MKFGVREICDVVLKAKAPMKVGNKTFYKNEPVIYFDTLKTSSLEGASTTVYATGGRGNARLISWDGERTVTFTMEDALISPIGFMILSGAGLIDATGDKPIYQHVVETTEDFTITPATNGEEDEPATTGYTPKEGEIKILLAQKPYLPADKNENYAYVMLMHDGEPMSEPFIPVHVEPEEEDTDSGTKWAIYVADTHEDYVTAATDTYTANHLTDFSKVTSVVVDYYVAKTGNAQQIEITPDSFGGNFYLEASTLFRDTNGVDMPAEFVIPNCRIQSNFTFTMASSGDPSTFTFTIDAFPDYTRFDSSKKVLAAIQIINDVASGDSGHRTQTAANGEAYFTV